VWSKFKRRHHTHWTSFELWRHVVQHHLHPVSSWTFLILSSHLQIRGCENRSCIHDDGRKFSLHHHAQKEFEIHPPRIPHPIGFLPGVKAKLTTQLQQAMNCRMHEAIINSTLFVWFYIAFLNCKGNIILVFVTYNKRHGNKRTRGI